MPQFNLGKEAAAFADELSDLLNSTVCNGVRLSSVVTDPRRVVVGYKITKLDLDPQEGIPVRLSAGNSTCYLSLLFRLNPDEAGRYLMVESSFMGIFADAQLTEKFLHWDYERHKEGYPEAHLQVVGESGAWASIRERCGLPTRTFERLHLPVGGRRFRPTLEDLLEFLIVERIAEARSGALEAITMGRDRFVEKQLRAAIRRNPEIARQALADLDSE